jgi:hypothetical protein
MIRLDAIHPVHGKYLENAHAGRYKTPPYFKGKFFTRHKGREPVSGLAGAAKQDDARECC